MKSFRRVFKYIWPQWPRIIGVVLSALVVSLLLSLSFMTVIPLLKVMMGEEGLHGWVEREISKNRYGMTFYVPDKIDFSETDIAHHLLITDIKRGSLAQKADIQKLDRIIGAAELLVRQDTNKIPSSKLLETLANAPANNKLTVQIHRDNKEGVTETKTLTLNSGPRPFYVDQIEKLLSLLPRERTKETKTKAVIFIILAMGVFTIIRCLAKFYQEYMAQKIVQVGINHLREDTFDHAMNMPIGFFSKGRPSDTVSRIVRDTSVMGMAIKIMLSKALREPLNALFMLAAAMWLNWQLTMIFLCGAPFVLWLLVAFGKKMKQATKKSLVAGSEMLSKLQEAMAGLKVVKVYDRYEYELETFKNINNRLLKQLLKISRVDAATMPSMEVLGMAAGSVALIFGAFWVTGGQMDGSKFLGLLVMLGFAAESARKTSDIWNKLQEANAAAERVFAVIDEPVELEKPDAIELPPLKEKIEFRNIVFTYPGSDRPTLKKINLIVQAGHNVAIVGPNGSGKTTLANLIPRFYNPDSGRILIDDIDIYDVTMRSLRGQISMVTQNVVTFNDPFPSMRMAVFSTEDYSGGSLAGSTGSLGLSGFDRA